LRHSRGVVLEKPIGKTGNSAEDIGSDARRHHRQSEERRSVADVKH